MTAPRGRGCIWPGAGGRRRRPRLAAGLRAGPGAEMEDNAAPRREGAAKVGKKCIIVVYTAAPVGAHARRGTAGTFLEEKPICAPSLRSGWIIGMQRNALSQIRGDWI